MTAATLRLATAVVLWLVATCTALAQSEPTEPPAVAQAEDARATQAPADAQAEDAKRLYAEGKVEFAQGRFEAAIALFERAYALSEAPGLLFNMAQAHRLAGTEHCPAALALYKSYLAALPAAENRREVEERIAELGECPPPPLPPVQSGPQVLLSAPEPPPKALPATEQRRVRPGPFVLAGVGGALLIAGGVMYARAAQKHEEAEEDCPCYPHTFDKWERMTTASYAVLGVGSATVLGAASWWLFAAPTGQGQATLGVAGRF